VNDRRATIVSVPRAVASGSIDPSRSSLDPVATAPGTDTKWVAAERLNQLRAIYPNVELNPQIEPPASYASDSWTLEDALVEVLRGRLDASGPITVSQLAESFSLPTNPIEQGLARLEGEGFAMQGRFTPGGNPTVKEGAEQSTGRDAGEPQAGMPALQPIPALTTEWCSRRLLARIHSYTLNRLRKEIEPVSPADFMRFLFV